MSLRSPAATALALIIAAATLPAAGPCAAAGADLVQARRSAFVRALEQAERGPPSAFAPLRAGLGDHPLAIWLDYAHLRRRLTRVAAAEVETFLDRHAGQPAAELLREAWLHELARRADWRRFLARYRETANLALRCAHARARLHTGNLDPAWFVEVEALWLHGHSMPDACDLPFAEFAARGRLDEALRWRRIELAAEAGEIGLMRFLARSLTAPQRQLAEAYASLLARPEADVESWPRDGRSRRFAAIALGALARRDPDLAEAHLAALHAAFGFEDETLAAIRYQIALWSAATYLPGAAQRLAAVPGPAWDQRLYRWRLREALARGDDAAALAAIASLPEAERADGGGRWDYFEARLRERAGDPASARALYARAAGEADFHGFLAADRLDLPYALCPISPDPDPALRAALARRAELIRAIELFRIDRLAWAGREWRALVDGLSARERIEAVRQARAAGWHDRGVFGLGREADELRYYRLRFPLPFARLVREQAEANALDPALVAALIRAESAWMRRARSPADARGLMQLLPGTGRRVARRLGLAWPGSDGLYRPSLNLTLGTAYLREQLDDFEGRPHLALAAYNAGPAPVARWRRQRPDLDPDLFIETIPFHETREYVARVLAFSVIYDWRLHGQAVPLGERLAGAAPSRPTRAIVCPTPTPPPAP